jgi:predicted GNAT family acetyltransferase
MPQVTHNINENRFESTENGLTSVAEYIPQGEIIVVTHIIVPSQLRGRGVASSLAAEVVAYARREKLKIRPYCSFMVTYLERHSEHRDLVV